jgi:hypothetical protein
LSCQQGCLLLKGRIRNDPQRRLDEEVKIRTMLLITSTNKDARAHIDLFLWRFLYNHYIEKLYKVEGSFLYFDFIQ